LIIKTPKFWFKKKNEINPLLFTLKPFSKIWEVVTRLRLDNGLWEKMPIPVLIQYQIDAWSEDLYQQNYVLLKVISRLTTGSLGPFKLDENSKEMYFRYYCLDETFTDNSDIEMNEMMEIFRNSFVMNVYGSVSAEDVKWIKTVRNTIIEFEVADN